MPKAFDTVSHKLLLYKLRYYGFNENSVSWLTSYLSDRRPVVKYCSKISANLPISRGVPQGSVLGPLLFILFINEFTAIFSDSSCHMYADDTSLYCHGPSLNYVQDILQDKLNAAEKWLFGNELLVNAKKSNVLLVSTKPLVTVDFRVSLCNLPIPVNDEVKLLGVFSTKLNFTSHVHNLLKKLSSKVGLPHRLSKSLEKEQLCLVYFALIQANIDYCLSIWGSFCNTHLNKIQCLQNRCAHIVTGVYDYNIPSSNLLLRLN